MPALSKMFSGLDIAMHRSLPCAYVSALAISRVSRPLPRSPVVSHD